MGYSTDHISAVEAWTATDYDADDLALDADITACMTNGTPAQDCDEFKEGTLNCRVEIDIDPTIVLTLKVRFYFNSVMTAGNNALLPYVDPDSVSITNEVVEDYTTPGQWIEHVCSPAFIAQLADQGGGSFAVRLASGEGGVSGVSKPKFGEVEIDITVQTYPLAGVTKNKDSDVLGSCEVALFKVISEGPPITYEFIEAKVSDAVTGAYSFDVPEGVKYMVSAIKPDGTTVMDVTPSDLEGVVP